MTRRSLGINLKLASAGDVESLRELAGRTVWDWRRCPSCGQSDTCKNGGYVPRPWTFTGRQVVRVQRHRCGRCRRSYSEQPPGLVRGSWYAREVHRMAVDHWQQVGSSLRRTAEWVRSWVGRQERWGLWRPLEERVEGRERCSLGGEHRAALAGQGGAGGSGGCGGAAAQAARGVRAELVALIHAIVDAPSYAQAEEAWEWLSRVAPEWLWRDYRLRLSHGRNHGSDERWERAALVWQVYHDFTPAQRRSERKRHYKHPGQSPLEAAGASPGEISYLDALGV